MRISGEESASGRPPFLDGGGGQVDLDRHGPRPVDHGLKEQDGEAVAVTGSLRDVHDGDESLDAYSDDNEIYINVEVHDPYSVSECVADLEKLGFAAEVQPHHWASVSGTRDRPAGA